LSIHPTAIVDGTAEIDPSATIGPYSIVTGEVRIGAETIVESHARIGSRYGRVTIGSHNHIQHGAVLGGPPQDLG
jgi:UDP-N-acetylglucosamine acyltransferase